MFSASGRTEKETFLNGSRKNTGIVLSKLLNLVLPLIGGRASLPRTFHTLPILCRWPMGRYAGSSIPGNYGRKDKKRARSPKIMPVLDSLKKAATLLCRLPLAAAAHGHGGPCNKFAALLAAICARIGSRKATNKAGFLPPCFVSPVVVWGMEVSACAGA